MTRCQVGIACVMLLFNVMVGSAFVLLVLMWRSDGRSVWIPWILGCALAELIVNLVVWVVNEMVYYDSPRISPKELV